MAEVLLCVPANGDQFRIFIFDNLVQYSVAFTGFNAFAPGKRPAWMVGRQRRAVNEPIYRPFLRQHRLSGLADMNTANTVFFSDTDVL